MQTHVQRAIKLQRGKARHSMAKVWHGMARQGNRIQNVYMDIGHWNYVFGTHIILFVAEMLLH